jgi:hypothetical protein
MVVASVCIGVLLGLAMPEHNAPLLPLAVAGAVLVALAWWLRMPMNTRPWAPDFITLLFVAFLTTLFATDAAAVIRWWLAHPDAGGPDTFTYGFH